MVYSGLDSFQPRSKLKQRRGKRMNRRPQLVQVFRWGCNVWRRELETCVKPGGTCAKTCTSFPETRQYRPSSRVPLRSDSPLPGLCGRRILCSVINIGYMEIRDVQVAFCSGLGYISYLFFVILSVKSSQ